MSPIRARISAIALAVLAGAISCIAQEPIDDFDAAWEAVRDTHFDPGYNGVDWNAVRDELRPEAVDASQAEVRGIIQEMLGRLGQSHFALLPDEGGPIVPYENGAADDETNPAGHKPAPLPRSELRAARGESTSGLADPGFDTRLIGDSVIVTSVRAGSPSEAAGVRTGWAVLGVGTRSVGEIVDEYVSFGAEAAPGLWVTQVVGSLLSGRAGSQTRVVFEDGAGEEIVLELEREAPNGPVTQFAGLPEMAVNFEARWLTEDELGGPGRVGLVRFNVWMIPVFGPFEAAMIEFADADGLVIDLRGNIGGVGILASGFARYLLPESASLGTMTMRSGPLHFNVQPVLVTRAGEPIDPFPGRLALLVDGVSASTSEIFAAGMQELGRARVFGDTTPGMALPAMMSTLPSGDVLMHAMASFETPGGLTLEARGVIPDAHKPWDRRSLLAGHDAALEAAGSWAVRK